jgi:phage/plasmid-associated DNA primase
MYSIDGYVRYSLENVFIGTGVGGNGKSLLNDLAMKTFGEYGYKLNSSEVTKKRT